MDERESNLSDLSSDSVEGQSNWPIAPPTLRLEQGVVDVWRVPIDQPATRLGDLAAWLAEDERERADRFRVEPKRVEFTVTRANLRLILSRLLTEEFQQPVAPRQVEFEYEPHGKPKLAGQFSTASIQFNATHSHGIAMIAATRSSRIGIDVEKVRDNRDTGELAKRWFSPDESSRLESLATSQLGRAFFLGWTRKEAFVKAIGDGITYGLDQFDVELDPARAARILKIKNDTEPAAAWSMCHMDPSETHVAAVAVESPNATVRCWSLA